LSAPSDPDLLDPAVLDGLFASLSEAQGILVAVSGGPDSMALLHLLARWRGRGERPRLAAATVDHGLRAEAAAEAALVARTAEDLAIPHRVLVWEGVKPLTRLQEFARDARYRLLAEHARAEGLTHLATAHTLDDQAETVLMRMARGSGPSGLAGMRPRILRHGLVLCRPLLDRPKADLVGLCRREGWPFAEDPSNRDDRFARVRWRRVLPQLAAEGLDARRLARLAIRAQRAEDALEAKAREALDRARGLEGLKASFLLEEPEEIALRVLALALPQGGKPLRLERLEAAAERLRVAARAGRALRLTLAGAVLTLGEGGDLTIAAEPLRRRGRYALVSDDDAGLAGSLGKDPGHA
jgi:tRNA(Ile)-lysidine synthase